MTKANPSKMEKTVTQIAAAITFTDRIFQYILELPFGIVVIDDICKEKNKEEFVMSVKRFIESGYGERYGFYCDFNSGLTKFQKSPLPNFKQKQRL